LQLAGLLTGPVAIKEPVSSLIAIAQSSRARSYRQQVGLVEQSYTVVALGASVSRRAWPIEAFAELTCRELLAKNWRIVLVGGPDLISAAREFKERVGADVLDLIGKTDFEQLVAVCGGANCFVGNESGPSHIAGACAVPTLVVTAFAKSGLVTHHASPARSHPVGPFVAVVQPVEQMPPCKTECTANEVHCIKQVTVEEAALAVQKLLAEASATSRVRASALEYNGANSSR
jgi:ADP-heptose:LPS heptosyltransferase